jgi:hypothetical protein
MTFGTSPFKFFVVSRIFYRYQFSPKWNCNFCHFRQVESLTVCIFFIGTLATPPTSFDNTRHRLPFVPTFSTAKGQFCNCIDINLRKTKTSLAFCNTLELLNRFFVAAVAFFARAFGSNANTSLFDG